MEKSLSGSACWRWRGGLLSPFCIQICLVFFVPGSPASSVSAAWSLWSGGIATGGRGWGFLAAFAVVLVWWLLMPPSNSRNWQPDVAVLPWADIQGNRVTIHNIRNCDYRSETDYTVRHYDKTFDLAKLKSVDLSLVYWGSPYIAHTMLSFGFEGDGYVCFSIETRKEIGEAYSTVKGFFRQYELTYVVADERDLIGLRTNYRGVNRSICIALMRRPILPGRFFWITCGR